MNPCSSSSSEFSINYKGNIIPITYSKFQHRLRELIAKICLNPKLFSSHSFRRGGATLAAQELLICLTMESHIKVTDLLSVKIKKTLKSFQNKVPILFRHHKLISQRTHDIFYLVYV
jgi:predicted lactoylglutathione lyase